MGALTGSWHDRTITVPQAWLDMAEICQATHSTGTDRKDNLCCITVIWEWNYAFPFVKSSIFQLIVLVLRPTTLLFWFTVTAVISIIIRQLYKPVVPYLSSTKWQTDTVSNQLVNIMEHLAAKEPDVSFRSWWRPKQSKKEGEYWTCMR